MHARLQLSIVVPLIPIIAKADSMTTDELDSMRELIWSQSQQHNISFFKFSDSALESVGATGAIPAVLYEEQGPSAPAVRSQTVHVPAGLTACFTGSLAWSFELWPAVFL